MKKILKSRIFLVLVTAIVFTGISVYATGQILASDVDYKDGKKVSQALDELYSKANNNTGYAALFNISRGISNNEEYIPVVYTNTNYVNTITDGIKIKKAGSYQLITTASHSANSNTTEVRLYVNGEHIKTSRHSIVAYDIINETLTLNENDEIKSSNWSDGNQGTKQGSTAVLINLN